MTLSRPRSRAEGTVAATLPERGQEPAERKRKLKLKQFQFQFQFRCQFQFQLSVNNLFRGEGRGVSSLSFSFNGEGGQEPAARKLTLKLKQFRVQFLFPWGSVWRV